MLNELIALLLPIITPRLLLLRIIASYYYVFLPLILDHYYLELPFHYYVLSPY